MKSRSLEGGCVKMKAPPCPIAAPYEVNTQHLGGKFHMVS